MNYEQLKEDLLWQLQPLMFNYGVDENCYILKQLVEKTYKEGWSEGYLEGSND